MTTKRKPLPKKRAHKKPVKGAGVVQDVEKLIRGLEHKTKEMHRRGKADIMKIKKKVHHMTK